MEYVIVNNFSYGWNMLNRLVSSLSDISARGGENTGGKEFV